MYTKRLNNNHSDLNFFNANTLTRELLNNALFDNVAERTPLSNTERRDDEREIKLWAYSLHNNNSSVITTYEFVFLQLPINHSVERFYEIEHPDWIPLTQIGEDHRITILNRDFKYPSDDEHHRIFIIPIVLSQQTKSMNKAISNNDIYYNLARNARKAGAILISQIDGKLPMREMVALYYFDSSSSSSSSSNSVIDDLASLNAAESLTHPHRVHVKHEEKTVTTYFEPVPDCLRLNCSYCLGDVQVLPKPQLVIPGLSLEHSQAIVVQTLKEEKKKKLRHLYKLARLSWAISAMNMAMDSDYQNDVPPPHYYDDELQ